MSPMRILGLVVLVIGVVLLVFGINATHSIGERVTEGVTGKYTSGTMWYIIAGIAGIVVGGALAGFGGTRHA